MAKGSVRPGWGAGMTTERDLDWAGILRFDQERRIANLRHDADAAGLRGDEWERARYLKEAAQLEMLPRLWEFGVQLTEEEYRAAGQVRSWIIHEQTIADLEETARRKPSLARWNLQEVLRLRCRIRYFWSSDGHLLYVSIRDDGRFVVNHGFLTPEWAQRLRRDMPQHAQLVTLYQKNQAAGRGHAGAPYGTPLTGVDEPEPLRLWRERVEGELRRRATQQGEVHDSVPDSQVPRLPDADPSRG